MKQYRLLWSSISTSRKIRKIKGSKWFRIGCHLVYTWLIPWADDDGRLRGEALWVLANILPNEDLSVQEIEKSLIEIDRVELILRYSVDGEEFIQISDWEDHQRIRKDRYKPSVYPNGNRMTTKCQPLCNPLPNTLCDGDGDGDGDKRGSGGEEKIKYAEFVHMTKKQRKQLIEKYSKDSINEMIEELNNYKGSSGKKYKSDYHAILTWVAKKVLQTEVSNERSRTSAGQRTSSGKTQKPAPYSDGQPYPVDEIITPDDTEA